MRTDSILKGKLKVEQQLKDKIKKEPQGDTEFEVNQSEVYPYEVAIDAAYANNPEFAALMKAFIQNKMETVAHITLLANLMVEKGVATADEVTNVLCEENMSMLVRRLKTAFSESVPLTPQNVQ